MMDAMATDDGFQDWNPEEELSRLKLESAVLDIGDPVATAMDTLRDAAPAAARAIIHMAIHSRDEKQRFAAAKYVVDKVTEGARIDDPFEKLLKQMTE